MIKISTLMDNAKLKKGIANDSALAIELNVQRQTISKWRHQEAYPGEEHITEMAKMAGDDPARWLVTVKAIRSKGSKAGLAWAELAERMAKQYTLYEV